jgi:hypothetical protein
MIRRWRTFPAWWGSPPPARKRRRSVTRKRDEHEELEWKTSVTSRHAVESSRVFQGIDMGQKPILKKTNTSFGPP